jgi:hypothetical protein
MCANQDENAAEAIDYFAILALETGESAVVAIYVYQITSATQAAGGAAAQQLTQIARVPLVYATALGDVTSYAVDTGASLAKAYDATTVSFANYAYILQSATTQVRTLYVGDTKISDVGPNTVLGKGLIFTDYVCL